MKRSIGYLIIVIMFLMCIEGCDPSGDLSVEETGFLYQELTQGFSDPSIWTGEISVDKAMNDPETTISFIRTAMELWQEDFDESNVIGRWYDSKSRCQGCTVYFDDAQIKYGDDCFCIRSIDIYIQQKRPYKYQVCVLYKSKSEDTSVQWVKIRLNPPT